MTTSDLLIPADAGRAALDEVGRVPWRYLQTVQGSPAPGDVDVEGALRRLRRTARGSFETAINQLFGSICHQGTICEATAPAVPFLAACAAGDDFTHRERVDLVYLLASIGVAAAYDAPSGSRPGTHGVDAGTRTRAAVTASREWLRRIADVDPSCAGFAETLTGLEADPAGTAERLAALLEALENA